MKLLLIGATVVGAYLIYTRGGAKQSSGSVPVLALSSNALLAGAGVPQLSSTAGATPSVYVAPISTGSIGSEDAALIPSTRFSRGSRP